MSEFIRSVPPEREIPASGHRAGTSVADETIDREYNSETPPLSQSSPAIDEGEVARFLQALTGSSKTQLHWRGFIDAQKGGPGRSTFGNLRSVLPELRQWQDDGCGVYIVVNEGGTDDISITGVRALFVDADRKDGQPFPLPTKWHAEPDFLADRGDGTRWHAYWRATPGSVTPDQFRPTQRALAAYYGTDKSVINPSRVMRVPGFLHLKDPANPKIYRVEERDPDRTRTFAELTAGLPEVVVEILSGRTAALDAIIDGPIALRLAEDMVASWPILKDGEGSDHGTFKLLARLNDYGISESEAVRLATPWAERCGFDINWIEKKARNAYRYAKNELGCDNMDALLAYCRQEPTDLKAQAQLQALNAEGAVAEVNRRYRFFTAGGNAAKVLDIFDPASPSIHTLETLHKMHGSEKVLVGEGKKARLVEKSRLWHASDDRQDVTGLVFEPPGSAATVRPDAHNMWQGFAVKPAEGKAHEPLLSHIRDVVCQGNAEQADWLIAWLADAVQCPGRKPGTAVALRGLPGCGKTIISEYMKAIFGRPHSMSTSSPHEVFGRFNGGLAPMVWVALEEGFWAGDKQAEGRLKDLITNPTTRVENKGVDGYTVSNHVHLFISSNEEWVVPAGERDRRFTVLDVPPTYIDNAGYWAPIWEALERGDGPANLLHFLLNVKYDRRKLLRPLNTAARADQLARSLPLIDQWWLNVLTEGDQPWFEDGWASKDAIYLAFSAFCGQRGRHIRVPDVRQFWARLRVLLGGTLTEKKVREGHLRTRVIQLPSLADARTTFTATHGIPFEDAPELADDEALPSRPFRADRENPFGDLDFASPTAGTA